jgi:hypothetical protein
VLISGSWHRAFNDDSSNNDNGGDSDNSDSVWPASPLTNNSLYSGKATYSNIDNASNSNDGPKD